MPDQDPQIDPKDAQLAELAKKLEATTKENTALTAAKTSLTSAVEKKDADLKAAQATVTDLKDKLKTAESDKATLTKSVSEKDKQLAQAEKVVNDLKTKLAATEEKIEKLPQVEVDGVAYELTTDFKWAGQVITIEVLKDNAKLAAELVREGVGNLRPVTD